MPSSNQSTSPARGDSASGFPADVPAVIFHDAAGSGLRVAALPLLDRLLVTVQRAGYGPITVVAPPGSILPPLRRTEAWGISFRTCARPPGAEEGGGSPVLVASSQVVVTVADLRRLREEGGGRLMGTTGERLDVGVLPAGAAWLLDSLESVTPRAVSGLGLVVRTREEARAAEGALWRSLTSSSDGLVDRLFNRPAGRPLSKLLIWTPITPNMISVGATLLGVLAAVLFAEGTARWSILAALILQFSAIVDCVDGDVARAVFKETKLGKWLDLVGDQVVHLGVFGGISVGLWRSGVGSHVGWLGLSAMAGAAMSFVVVMRGMQRASRAGKATGGLMQRMLDSATNRDFSVLVLLLACLEWLEGFLWMAAVGSHLFWLALLALQGRQQESARRGGVE